MVHFNLFDLFVYHRWGKKLNQHPQIGPVLKFTIEYSVFERTQARWFNSWTVFFRNLEVTFSNLWRFWVRVTFSLTITKKKGQELSITRRCHFSTGWSITCDLGPPLWVVSQDVSQIYHWTLPMVSGERTCRVLKKARPLRAQDT